MMQIQQHTTFTIRTEFTEEEAAVLAWLGTMGYDNFKKSLKLDASFQPDESDIRGVFIKLQDMRKEVFKISDLKKRK